jgi:uncharacterized membrane protein
MFCFTFLLGIAISLFVSRVHIGEFKVEHSRDTRWADGVFLAMVALYGSVFATLSARAHLAFSTAGFDVGVFDQAIWNSLCGRLLEASIVYDSPTLLGQRFSPILLAFVPLYALWDSPIALLVTQTLALASAAFPIYWFARQRLDYALALAIVLAYFLYPALQYVNLYEFHEVALVTPLFAFGTFFLLRYRYKELLVCLGLALLCKEEIAFTVIMFGTHIVFIQRRRVLGSSLIVFGLVWGIFLLQFLIPYFRSGQLGGDYYYFGHGLGTGKGRYDYLGSSLAEIVQTIATRPDFILQRMMIPPKIEYILHLLIPTALTALVGIEVAALGLATLGLSLLSNFPSQFSIESHYAAPMIPFIFFASVIGLERILNRFSAHANKKVLESVLIVLILSTSISSFLLYAPGPLALRFRAERYTVTSRDQVAEKIVESIPREAVVLAQSDFAAHLTHRRGLYEYPYIEDYRRADYLIADTRFPRLNILDVWRSWEQGGYFEVVSNEDAIVLAKRRTPAYEVDVSFGDQFTLLGYTVLPQETLRGGDWMRVFVLMRANKSIVERYAVTLSVVDAEGHLWTRVEREPHDGATPTTEWRAGQVVGDVFELRLPPTMPRGEYYVTMAMRQASAPTVNDDVLMGGESVIATVGVEKNKGSFTASQIAGWIAQPLYVDMGEIRFLGYVPPRETISAGELLQMGLYWRARGKPQGDYIVAVQLRDTSGRIVYEHWNRPAKGTYPTTEWDEGEVLLDWHDFELPGNIAAGEYQLVAVLRQKESEYMLGEVRVASLRVVK